MVLGSLRLKPPYNDQFDQDGDPALLMVERHVSGDRACEKNPL
jgi:hypothetical protein